MAESLSSLFIALGIFVGWFFIQIAKTIAHRGSTVVESDRSVDLTLSCDRDLFVELKDIVDAEVSSVMKLAPYNENARQLVELVGNRIFKEIAVRVDRSKTKKDAGV